MTIRFSEEEIAQLIKAWAAIALAFTLANTVGSRRMSMESIFEGPGLFLQIFFISAVTVGLAFLLHELAHKFVAQRYGCWAEFRSFDQGLFLALLMSLSGFVFAAPGAVMISGVVSTSENGKIAAAGPLTNIILAVLFFGVYSLFAGPGFWQTLLLRGGEINAWLAIFNLIPFGPLDGAKVLRWSPVVWIALLGAGLVLMF